MIIKGKAWDKIGTKYIMYPHLDGAFCTSAFSILGVFFFFST